MQPDEQYAHRRLLSAGHEEMRAWRELGLDYDRILDLLKEEFWLARESPQDSGADAEAMQGFPGLDVERSDVEHAE